VPVSAQTVISQADDRVICRDWADIGFLFIIAIAFFTADNLMLRGQESLRLVMIDFGLSVESNYVPVNTGPTGSQTHWSPEKAASEGYDFGADVWAAVAVLVHMLSGSEPWILRYKDAPFLHFIVSTLIIRAADRLIFLIAINRAIKKINRD